MRFQELEVEEEEPMMLMEEAPVEEHSEPASPTRDQMDEEPEEVHNEPRRFVDPSPSSRSKAETPTGRPTKENKSNLSNLFSVKNKLINKVKSLPSTFQVRLADLACQSDSAPKGNFMEKINAIKKSSSTSKPKAAPAMPFGVSRLGKSKTGK